MFVYIFYITKWSKCTAISRMSLSYYGTEAIKLSGILGLKYGEFNKSKFNLMYSPALNSK